jgi:hypothetical protein
MKNWFQKVFNNPTSSAKVAHTDLLEVFLNNKKVGILLYDGNTFTFQYEREVSPFERIVGVDNGNFKNLPAFFTARIPSSERPEVSQELKKHSGNPIRILGTLGSESAISPYRFNLVPSK